MTKTSLVRLALRTVCLAGGALLVLAAVAGTAYARNPLGGDAPEIDPGSLASALALFSGGVLMLRARRK
jgi:hypothetical protein